MNAREPRSGLPPLPEFPVPSTGRSSLAKRLVSGAAWALAGKIVGVVSGLAVNALLARMLTAEDMGAYFLLVSIVTFAAALARFGLKQTVVRLVAESVALGVAGRARKGLRIVYRVTALGVTVVGGSYYLGVGKWLAQSAFEMPPIAAVIGSTTIWIAILAFQTPVAETFRGLHDIRAAVFLDGILANAMLAVTLGLLWHAGAHASLSDAVTFSTLAAAVSLCLGVILFLRGIKSLRGEGDISAREVLTVSGPIFVTNMAGLAMTSSSLWIVGAFLGAQDVAQYGAAWKLVSLVSLPLLLMNMSVQPVICELYATNSKQSLQAALRSTATLAGLPSAAMLVAFIAAGSDILDLVYGPDYRGAYAVLAALSMGLLVNVWSGSCGMVLTFTGHQRQLMAVTLGSGLASVILTVAGVQWWGVIGAAAGVSAGLAVQNISAWLAVHYLTGLWTHGTLRPRLLRQAVIRVRRH